VFCVYFCGLEMTTTPTIITTTQATAPVVISLGAGASTMVQERLRGMDNYRTWKFTMKMALVLEGLYDCVTGTDTDEARNQVAIAQIALCVQP
jgi:hypothetical protein